MNNTWDMIAAWPHWWIVISGWSYPAAAALAYFTLRKQRSSWRHLAACLLWPLYLASRPLVMLWRRLGRKRAAKQKAREEFYFGLFPTLPCRYAGGFGIGGLGPQFLGLPPKPASEPLLQPDRSQATRIPTGGVPEKMVTRKELEALKLEHDLIDHNLCEVLKWIDGLGWPSALESERAGVRAVNIRATVHTDGWKFIVHERDGLEAIWGLQPNATVWMPWTGGTSVVDMVGAVSLSHAEAIALDAERRASS